MDNYRSLSEKLASTISSLRSVLDDKEKLIRALRRELAEGAEQFRLEANSLEASLKMLSSHFIFSKEDLLTCILKCLGQLQRQEMTRLTEVVTTLEMELESTKNGIVEARMQVGSI